MALYKRTRFWWGSYHDPRTGEFVRRSTKCADRAAAAAVVREWERASSDPHHRATHSTTLRVAIATYKAQKLRDERTKATLGMIATHSGHFARVIGDETLVRAIRAIDVDKYISTRHTEGAARVTIAKELSTLRGILKLAHRHGYCEPPSTVMPISFEAKSKPITRKLATIEDLQKLVWSMPPHRGAHILYLVATGADWSASLLARQSDISATSIAVRGTKTDARARRVPIIDMTRPLIDCVLAATPKTGPMFAKWGNVRRDLALYCDRAGIPRITPRDCRRTIGTWLRARGVPPHLIAEWLGHADARMAERVYAKLDAAQLGTQVRAALSACAADVREPSELGGSNGHMGRDGSAENLEKPGAQGQNRTVDTRIFSPTSLERKPVKRIRNFAVVLPDGTRLYGRPVRTMGDLVDDTIALGGAG